MTRVADNGIVRIDLHTHSTASDGLDSPAEVMRRAAAAGLTVVALTDHDTVAGHLRAGSSLRSGQTLVTGAELSCLLRGVSVHLLAYLFDPAEPSLAAEMERVRTDRQRRARDMVDRLAQLGVPVTWEQVRRLAGGGDTETVGRPHVAQAMVEVGAVPDVPSAFTSEWLGPGGRAYVAKYAPEPAHAVSLVRAAGGVSVLAHPAASERDGGLDDEEEIARLAAAGLGGLEIDHPVHDRDVRKRLRGLAAELRLAVTGGSDNHGYRAGEGPGSELTAPEEYEKLVSAASGAAPVVG